MGVFARGGAFALVVVAALAHLGPARAQDLTPGATGAKDPTPEQQKEFAARQILGVRANKVAIDRLNAERARRGLPPLDASQAASGADEVLAAGTTSTSGTTTVLGATPGLVDNSQNPAAPPIGNQGPVGSCVAWATTYYQLSYETAFARGGTNTSTSSPTVFSAKWTYNMINGGVDGGSYVSDAYSILQKHGAASLAQWPYDTNYLAWDLNGAHWRSAISYRANAYQTVSVSTATGIANAKQMLANGHVLGFATYISSWNYASIPNDPATTADDPFVGQRVMTYQSGTSGGHMMTVVGYDDDIWVDLNGNGVVDAGEKGAFKIANSWGTGWGNAGFIWVSYDAFFSTSQVAGGPSTGRVAAAQSNCFFYLPVKASYSPTVLGQFTVSHATRNQMSVSLGVSATTATAPSSTFTPSALNYRGGAYAFNGTTTECDGTFVLDYTDIVPSVTGSQNYYLAVTDSSAGNPATLKAFALIDVGKNQTVALQSGLPATADATSTRVFLSYDLSSGDQAPIARIAATQTPSGSGVSVFFDGGTSSDPDGSIVSYSWNFGDGSATQTGATATHLYTKVGTSICTLTVTDNVGVTGQATYSVTVADTQAPTTPTNLTASLGTTTSGRGKKATTSTVVNLSWSASTDNSGSVSYAITRNGAVIATISGTSYQDKSTTAGATYTYSVVAMDPSGNKSASSNTASVTR